MINDYVSPQKKEKLSLVKEGLIDRDDNLFSFLQERKFGLIPDFTKSDKLSDKGRLAFELYNKSSSAERYGNELNWLYETFGVEENSFRKDLIERLKVKEGGKMLITACGLGHDILPALALVGNSGEVYAQDLAHEMVIASAFYVKTKKEDVANLYFSVSDANSLPFPDNFFDGVFHFGGINLFDNIETSIKEMERVVKVGGRVVFGDESVAPWLRNSDYGKAAICNNSLWEVFPPLEFIPEKAIDVNLSWVFGNCFYVIEFTKSEIGPYMNMDIPHIGLRGGSMRTRYFGKLEGVKEETRKFVIEEAARQGMSIHDWLEKLIREKM